MQLTQSQLHELRTDFSFYRIIEKVEGRAYPDPDAFDVVVIDAARYGAPAARSAWTRACFEAQKAGKIVYVPRSHRRRKSTTRSELKFGKCFRATSGSGSTLTPSSPRSSPLSQPKTHQTGAQRRLPVLHGMGSAIIARQHRRPPGSSRGFETSSGANVNCL